MEGTEQLYLFLPGFPTEVASVAMHQVSVERLRNGSLDLFVSLSSPKRLSNAEESFLSSRMKEVKRRELTGEVPS